MVNPMCIVESLKRLHFAIFNYLLQKKSNIGSMIYRKILGFIGNLTTVTHGITKPQLFMIFHKIIYNLFIYEISYYILSIYSKIKGNLSLLLFNLKRITI